MRWVGVPRLDRIEKRPAVKRAILNGSTFYDLWLEQSFLFQQDKDLKTACQENTGVASRRFCESPEVTK